MTCFRTKEGLSIRQWCISNNVPYHCFYRAMDRCSTVEEACEHAVIAHKSGKSHPKRFYKGVPIVSMFKYGTPTYYRVISRVNKRGWALEKSVEFELGRC